MAQQERARKPPAVFQRLDRIDEQELVRILDRRPCRQRIERDTTAAILVHRRDRTLCERHIAKVEDSAGDDQIGLPTRRIVHKIRCFEPKFGIGLLGAFHHLRQDIDAGVGAGKVAFKKPAGEMADATTDIEDGRLPDTADVSENGKPKMLMFFNCSIDNQV